MKKFKACFILENGKYMEVPAERVLENGNYKEEYKGRCFYPINDYLLEMSRKDRRYFYDCQEAMANMIRHPKKRMKKEDKIIVVSIEELIDHTADGNMYIDFVDCTDTDVAEQVEHELLMKAVKTYRQHLSPAENVLLTEYYEDGYSDRELARKYGVHQSTITKRRQRILAKPLKLIENGKK